MLTRPGLHVVGLTGGMGAGKSTVAELFAERGAVVIDADAIAREVVEPGTAALAAIADRFGQSVVGPDGSLDRAGLAAIVFADEEALADLESITHPAIRSAIEERLAAIARDRHPDAGAELVVVDHPLLVETGLHEDVDVVVVVTAPVALRLDRLVAHRGVDREDAQARIARQADDEQRQAVADVVLDNDGDIDDLAAALDQAWSVVAGASDDGAGVSAG